MLYKVRGKAIEKVNQTKFKEEEKLERDLEDWIENNPSIIGERLLIFGRQVQIPEVNDRIDLLALDTNGKVVIIELKRGKLKHPVDIQSLRYASYVSRFDRVRIRIKKDFELTNDKFLNFLRDCYASFKKV